MGCIAASIALAVCGLSVLPPLVAGSNYTQWSLSVVSYTPEVSFAVMGSWLALALGRRWRAQPTWLDRAGRALAASWIAANALAWLRLCLL
ncbi:MAG TPA: hypothetical protein VGY53_13040 [Isosphaeraceae bacterium]|nr:hypothetical protein [Isosphaeraceae bacterium]